MLEHFNPETFTCFTPVGELEMALHEMEEVSMLLHGDLPYKEHVPTGSKLDAFAKENPTMYGVY